MAPGTKETLKMLAIKGIKLVVISANPYAEEVAVKEIKERIDHFSLTDLFYAYRSSPGDDPNGKVVVILEIIATLGLTNNDALMVGDSYFYDYQAPREAGIDALYIENEVSKMPDSTPKDLQSIKEVSDLLNILE